MLMFNQQLASIFQEWLSSSKLKGVMEGRAVDATKRMLVVTMLSLAVVVVQAQEVSPPNPSTSPDEQEKINCHLKCVGECLKELNNSGAIGFGICIAHCVTTGCKNPQQNAVVLGCTEKCAVSKTVVFKPGMTFNLILLNILSPPLSLSLSERNSLSLSSLYFLVD